MPDEFQQDNIKIAYWINTHHDLLVKIGYGVAIFFISIMWLNVLRLGIGVALTFSETRDSYSAVSRSEVIYDSIVAPSSLRVVDSGLIPSGTGTYDAFALISNPNPHHAVNFEYTFSAAGDSFTLDDTFIMPESDAYVVARGFQSTNTLSSVDIDIENEVWHRIRGKQPVVQIDFSETELIPIAVVEIEEPEESTDRTGATDVLDEGDDTTTDELDDETATDDTTTDETESEESADGPTVVDPADEDDETITGVPTEVDEEESDDVPTPGDDEKITPDSDNEDESDAGAEATYTALNTFANNNSALGFRSMPIVVVLKNNAGSIVGVHKEIVRDFDSFTQNDLQFTWPKRFTIDTTAELFGYADYKDEANLIYPGDEE